MAKQPPLNWSEISRRLGYDRNSLRPHLLRKKHVPMMDRIIDDLAEWWKVRRAELLGEHDQLPDELDDHNRFMTGL